MLGIVLVGAVSSMQQSSWEFEQRQRVGLLCFFIGVPLDLLDRVQDYTLILYGRVLGLHCSKGKKDGKYLSEESVHRVYGSTVVEISIPLPSFKPVSLYLSRYPLSKTPKQVFFYPIKYI